MLDGLMNILSFIKTLPKTSVANTDLKRTISLINNALPNMFHYLKDQNIAPTTNLLENLYSQLKHQYCNHRGGQAPIVWYSK